MFRLLGQFLSFVALMASAINAQCALSCSLHAIPPTSAREANAAQSPLPGHSCCPQRKSTAPDHPNGGRQPCPAPLTVVRDVAAVASLQHPDASQPLDLAYGNASCLVLRLVQSASPMVANPSGLPDIPAFSVLRI